MNTEHFRQRLVHSSPVVPPSAPGAGLSQGRGESHPGLAGDTYVFTYVTFPSSVHLFIIQQMMFIHLTEPFFWSIFIGSGCILGT